MVLVTFYSLLNLKATYKALILSVSMLTYLHIAGVDPGDGATDEHPSPLRTKLFQL